MKWTAEQKEIIAGRLRAGESAGQICLLFPGVSRNAIIGVVHRDKMLRQIGFGRDKGDRRGCGRHQRNGTTPKRRTVSKGRKVKLSAKVVSLPSRPEPVRRPGEPQIVGRPIMDLRAFQCRFAVNDAERSETHLFCAMPSDGPYCDHHRRLVYQPHSALVRSNKRLAA